MANQLTFSTGLVEYELNGRVTVAFNPTDADFIERIFDSFDELDRRQEGYSAEIEAQTDNAGVFVVARRMDSEMRVVIDAALGDGVAEGVFGAMNVYALADGLPVWCNLMLAIIDEMDSGFAREKKASNPRVQKYLAKYKRNKK